MKGNHRARWAAIGAAVAVTLGAGGLVGVNAANENAANENAATLTPIQPVRILDTRSGNPVGSLNIAGDSDPYRLKVAGVSGSGIPQLGVTGVSLNVTAVSTRANDFGGFVTVYPCDSISSPRPDVSNINFVSGQTLANAVVVPVSDDGYICLYVYGAAHLLVDANGYYSVNANSSAVGYTADEVDALLDSKADASGLYSSDEVDALLDSKADASGLYSSDEVDALLDSKADVVSCDPNQLIRVENGQFVCVTPVQSPSVSDVTVHSIDATDNIYEVADAVLDPNGRIVLAYTAQVASGYEIRVRLCVTSACQGTTPVIISNTSWNLGRYVNVEIGPDGFPIIAAQGALGDDVYLITCTASDCSQNSPRLLSSVGMTGEDLDMVLGTSGNPFLAYRADNSDLGIQSCMNNSCSVALNSKPVTAGNTGLTPAVALRPDGTPAIVYHRNDDTTLHFYSCTDALCTGGTDTEIVDLGNGFTHPAIAIGEDGFPMIFYTDDTATVGTANLYLMDCADNDCQTSTVTELDDPLSNNYGYRPTVRIRDNGLPLVVYGTDSQLRVLSCLTTDCSSTEVETLFGADTKKTGAFVFSSEGQPSYYFVYDAVLYVAAMTIPIVGYE